MRLRVLTEQDLIEIEALYRWGAHMRDIIDLYGVHKCTIKENLKKRGVKLRATGRAPLATSRDKIKSTRPKIPAGALIGDGAPTPDQLLGSSARAQRDKRTAERREGGSRSSCQEGAFECRYAFLRSGNRLPDLE